MTGFDPLTRYAMINTNYYPEVTTKKVVTTVTEYDDNGNVVKETITEETTTYSPRMPQIYTTNGNTVITHSDFEVNK